LARGVRLAPPTVDLRLAPPTVDPEEQDRGGQVVPHPAGGRSSGRIVTGQERRIEAVRQWSGLLSEQVSGWGSLLAGAIGLLDPAIASQSISSHPIGFLVVGGGILAGKKLAAMLKAALSISI
jgi:hypothetical protein